MLCLVQKLWFFFLRYSFEDNIRSNTFAPQFPMIWDIVCHIQSPKMWSDWPEGLEQGQDWGQNPSFCFLVKWSFLCTRYSMCPPLCFEIWKWNSEEVGRVGKREVWPYWACQWQAEKKFALWAPPCRSLWTSLWWWRQPSRAGAICDSELD